MGGTELVKVLQNIAQVNEPYRLPDTAIDRHRVVWPHLPASEPAPPYFTGAPKACGVQADAAVAAYQGHANDLAGLEAHTGSGFLIQLHTESGCAIELEGSIHFEEMRRAAHPDCMGCSIEDIEANAFAYRVGMGDARWRGYARGQRDGGSLTSCGKVLNPRYQRITSCHVRTPSRCRFALDETHRRNRARVWKRAAGFPDGVNARAQSIGGFTFPASCAGTYTDKKRRTHVRLF
jgi:hypothetical protein